MNNHFKELLNNHIHERIDEYEQRFNAALADDLNTPKALAIMHELCSEINKTTHPFDKLGLQEALRGFMQRTGLIT